MITDHDQELRVVLRENSEYFTTLMQARIRSRRTYILHAHAQYDVQSRNYTLYRLTKSMYIGVAVDIHTSLDIDLFATSSKVFLHNFI